jgi:hypothetical protein
LAKEYKKELKYCAGNLMQLQLRQLVDRSVNKLKEFFIGFSTLYDLKKEYGIFDPPI